MMCPASGIRSSCDRHVEFAASQCTEGRGDSPVTVVSDAKTGQSISLLSLYPKNPLVLFFASYSCACSQKVAGLMADLNTKYGDQFQFLLIYIREAHPKTEFSPGPAGEKFAVKEPQTPEERAAMALRFAREQKIGFPVLVDSMDNTQAIQWGAWPARLFVISTTGKVVYAGEPGPWYVKPTETFDLGFHGVPKQYGNLPGYSWGNLEEFFKEKFGGLVAFGVACLLVILPDKNKAAK